MKISELLVPLQNAVLGQGKTAQNQVVVVVAVAAAAVVVIVVVVAVAAVVGVVGVVVVVPLLPLRAPPCVGRGRRIYGNMHHQDTPNVSIYTIHGSYGIYIYISVIPQYIIYFCEKL